MEKNKFLLFMPLCIFVFMLLINEFLFASEADNKGWSKAKTIVTLNGDDFSRANMAVTEDANWHVVFSYRDSTDGHYPVYNSIKYKSSASELKTIIEKNNMGDCPANWYSYPSIAADLIGNLHIAYREVETDCEEALTSIKYINNVSGNWSPKPIIVQSVKGQSISEPMVAVDRHGDWHVVFSDLIFTNGSYPFYSYIKHKSAASDLETIVTGVVPAQCQGNKMDDPAIAVDSNGNLHVTYREIEFTGVCGEETTSTKYINNISGSWSTPLTIVSKNGQGIGGSKITVDTNGNWHVVYSEAKKNDEFFPCYIYIKYKSSASDLKPIDLAVGEYIYACQGKIIGSPAIAVDSNGNLHVTYHEIEYAGVCEEGKKSIKYINKNSQKLFVTIPGNAANGSQLLKRARFMFNYSPESCVVICEKANQEGCNLNKPSEDEVRLKIVDAVEKAKENGKDIIVTIDMNLEMNLLDFVFQYLLPFATDWHPSVRWAGRISNIVSDVFHKENPSGFRMFYAHSAGADAVNRSILTSKEAMYEKISLFNGRTGAKILKNALLNSGYQWWQVNIFTNKKDLWAAPKWSIANYDGAKNMAGKAWVHLNCTDVRINKNSGHNWLINNINIDTIFEVNLDGNSTYVTGTVEDMMLGGWQTTQTLY